VLQFLAMLRVEFVRGFRENSDLIAPADDLPGGRAWRHVSFGQAGHLKILLVVNEDAAVGIEHIEAVTHVVERILEQLALQPLRAFAALQPLARTLALGDVLMDDDPAAFRTRMTL